MKTIHLILCYVLVLYLLLTIASPASAKGMVYQGDLTGATIPSSGGHLLVIVGFDGVGNPIVNDPAAASNDEVQRTYLRSEFEPLWLSASGGLVYLIYPSTTVLPGWQ